MTRLLTRYALIGCAMACGVLEFFALQRYRYRHPARRLNPPHG